MNMQINILHVYRYLCPFSIKFRRSCSCYVNPSEFPSSIFQFQFELFSFFLASFLLLLHLSSIFVSNQCRTLASIPLNLRFIISHSQHNYLQIIITIIVSWIKFSSLGENFFKYRVHISLFYMEVDPTNEKGDTCN